jgi:hypothetical protein
MKYINLTIDDKGKYNCEYDNMDKLDIITYIELLEKRFDLKSDEIYKKMKKEETT